MNFTINKMANLDYIQENRKSYNDMAPFYKIKRDSRGFEIYQDIIEFTNLLEWHFQNPKVLDIGPGADVISKYFSQKGFKTTAIDISEEMIKVAKETSPETRYLVRNFLEYNFGDEKFDCLFAKAILHLFSRNDAYDFIKKSNKLLASEGLFYLSLFLRNESNEGFREKNMMGKKFVRFTKDWTKNELEELIDDSDFHILRTFSMPYGTMTKWSGILRK